MPYRTERYIPLFLNKEHGTKPFAFDKCTMPIPYPKVHLALLNKLRGTKPLALANANEKDKTANVSN